MAEVPEKPYFGQCNLTAPIEHVQDNY